MGVLGLNTSALIYTHLLIKCLHVLYVDMCIYEVFVKQMAWLGNYASLSNIFSVVFHL